MRNGEQDDTDHEKGEREALLERHPISMIRMTNPFPQHASPEPLEITTYERAGMRGQQRHIRLRQAR